MRSLWSFAKRPRIAIALAALALAAAAAAVAGPAVVPGAGAPARYGDESIAIVFTDASQAALAPQLPCT
jgi:hypothetical protein